MIYSLGERRIETQGEFFVADSASVVGSVRLGANASVWFNAVLRGDTEWIEVGETSNVQDGSVLHTDPGKQMILGARVTVGHMVMLHGCAVAPDSLIGNGAIVLDEAQIGSWCLVAAGTLIPPRMVVPEGSLVMGAPARVVRETNARERERIAHSAIHYAENAATYRRLLRPDDRFNP
jgi:carbonic anhydrase/acetyltransferase-like protein (isoleucine patch superfamily)